MLNLPKLVAGETPDYTKSQVSMLVILRILIGWHFLYEGMVKFMNPNWTSAGFLSESKWIFTPVFDFILSNPTILRISDLMNIYGLTFIGLGLILGTFTRLASLSGMFILLLYYVCNPPLIGLKYSAPAEGSYLIINKNLIEMFALGVLTVFPTGIIVGIDRIIFGKKN